VFDNDGDYFHEQAFHDHHSFQFFPDRPVATTYRPPYMIQESEQNNTAGLAPHTFHDLKSHQMKQWQRGRTNSEEKLAH
jgi:hypothetical protein